MEKKIIPMKIIFRIAGTETANEPEQQIIDDEEEKTCLKLSEALEETVVTSEN